MSDTPRTDAAILTEPFQIRTLSFEVVHVEVAEQLERELAAANSKLSTVFQWINRNHPDGFIDSQSHLQNLERVTDLHHDRLDAAQREQAKWQALAERLATASKAVMEEYEDRKCQYGGDYLWQKHEDVAVINRASETLAAYESAKKPAASLDEPPGPA